MSSCHEKSDPNPRGRPEVFHRNHPVTMLNSHHHAAAAAANMYPWYRDSMSQLGQFCGAAAAHGANIKTENGYNDCMLALDYAQTKVGHP